MIEEAPERERQSIAGLLFAHGVLLVLFDAFLAVASIRTTAMTAAVARDAGNGWSVGGPAIVALLQLAAAAGVLGCGGFEALVGWRVAHGRALPFRGPALAGVVGSVLLLPASIVGCSVCGLLFWALPLGFALSTGIAAWRVPDPRGSGE